MNFDALEKFLHVANSENIQQSALELNITAGALSKTIKKLEQQLNTRLFERVGRNIVLNREGQKFSQYAARLCHEYQQICSEFAQSQQPKARIVGPAILQGHSMAAIVDKLVGARLSIDIATLFEGDALKTLSAGHADIAVVTQQALVDWQSSEFEIKRLCRVGFKLVASRSHCLIEQHHNDKMTIAQVLQHGFVCPTRSAFCGLVRGIGSDGWPDAKYARNIVVRSDDFSTLLVLVKQGVALAYVPDIVVDDGLVEVDVVDFDHPYYEQVVLAYKPSFAHGWLNQLMASL